MITVVSTASVYQGTFISKIIFFYRIKQNQFCTILSREVIAESVGLKSTKRSNIPLFLIQ